MGCSGMPLSRLFRSLWALVSLFSIHSKATGAIFLRFFRNYLPAKFIKASLGVEALEMLIPDKYESIQSIGMIVLFISIASNRFRSACASFNNSGDTIESVLFISSL